MTSVPARYAHVDALRAFAVMLVVVAHAGFQGVVPGGAGVTVFFAISGFIITYLMLRERDTTGAFAIGHFYVRRIFKIAPPLMVLVVIPTLVFATYADVNFGALATQVLFVHNWFRIDGGTGAMPGSGVVWSLSVEEQFYIAFAAFWLLAVRRKHYLGLVTGLAALVLVASEVERLLLALEGGNSFRIYQGTDTRASSIALGVLAAVVYYHWTQGFDGRLTLTIRRWASSDWMLPAAVGLFVVSLLYRDPIFRDTLRYSLQSLSACMVILFGLANGGGRLWRLFASVTQWRLVQAVGLASYSIYLCDKTFVFIIDDLDGILPTTAVRVLSIVVPVVVGYVVYRSVEVPFERLRRRLRPSPVRMRAADSTGF